MQHKLRFQVAIMPNSDYETMLDRVRYVEANGFDMVTTGDHWVDWTNPDRPWLEPWVAMAGLARDTSRIRLAHYVSQIPLRHPAMLARQALTMDHLSGGRFEVGLGIGLEIDPSYEMIGIPNWPVKERVARLPNYIEVVDRLLSNEVTTYEGEYWSVKDAVMNPRPVQSPRPPIVIAALGPVMLRITARYADNWNTLSFAQTFDAQVAETKERIARMDDNLAKLGRDKAEVRYSYQMFDPESRASGGEITYYQSTDAFLEKAEALIEAGMTELGLYFPLIDSQRGVFEEIGNEILPALKKKYAPR
jgi:alkanesulfonate monooxygenase SsuD/methylene tetrahydromethanopterin reductase-like flavin-dependent oxidoreductase (luciferase family)